MVQQETDRQSGLPSLLRGQTSSEVEAQFVQACQHADSAGSGLISRQVSLASHCSIHNQTYRSPIVSQAGGKPLAESYGTVAP